VTEEPREDYWEGSPLQMGDGLDPYGIKEIVIEFDTGDEEVLTPALGEEYGSYGLWEAARYIENLYGKLN
jgi:hypothetical protein